MMYAIRTGQALNLLRVGSSATPIRRTKSWIVVSRQNPMRVHNEHDSIVRVVRNCTDHIENGDLDQLEK